MKSKANERIKIRLAEPGEKGELKEEYAKRIKDNKKEVRINYDNLFRVITDKETRDFLKKYDISKVQTSIIQSVFFATLANLLKNPRKKINFTPLQIASIEHSLRHSINTFYKNLATTYEIEDIDPSLPIEKYVYIFEQRIGWFMEHSNKFLRGGKSNPNLKKFFYECDDLFNKHYNISKIEPLISDVIKAIMEKFPELIPQKNKEKLEDPKTYHSALKNIENQYRKHRKTMTKRK